MGKLLLALAFVMVLTLPQTTQEPEVVYGEEYGTCEGDCSQYFTTFEEIESNCIDAGKICFHWVPVEPEVLLVDSITGDARPALELAGLCYGCVAGYRDYLACQGCDYVEPGFKGFFLAEGYALVYQGLLAEGSTEDEAHEILVRYSNPRIVESFDLQATLLVP